MNELKEKNRLLVESEERAKQLQKDLFLEIEKSNDKIRATEEKLSKSRETNSKKSEHEVEINNYASVYILLLIFEYIY